MITKMILTMMGQMRVKKIEWKQFQLFDKTGKKLTVDGETNFFLRRLKMEKKLLIKINLGNILATNLLNQ